MLLIAVFILNALLSACEDRYRYTCQDPENFSKDVCQRPRCEFDQDCPDYLVAPILEKKIEGNTAGITQQSQGQTQCR